MICPGVRLVCHYTYMLLAGWLAVCLSVSRYELAQASCIVQEILLKLA